MRIVYFYAEGMAGIKVGSSLDKIEIDFSNNKNDVILILGSNGGGKSSLLSILHPLRDTNDNRSVVFKDSKGKDKKGYKEVHIQEGKDLYICKHYWKPNKSFISKNGVELNESGSIKEFNKYAELELGITSDYFKIGRLGSNVSNFIDSKSTDRKAYVGDFLPDIEDYLIMYGRVRKNFTYLNKELNNIGGQLDKFPEYTILEDKIKLIDTGLDSNGKILKDLVSEKIRLQEESRQEKERYNTENGNIYNLTKLNKLLDGYIKDQFETESEFRENTTSIEECEDIMLFSDYIKKEKFIKELREDLLVSRNKVDKNLSVVSTKLSNYISKKNEIGKKLEVFSFKDIDIINTEIKDMEESNKIKEKEIMELEEKLTDYFLDIAKEYTLDNINALKFEGKQISTFIINGILGVYKSIDNYDFKLYKDNKDTIQSRIDASKEIVKDLTSKIVYIENNTSIMDVLKKKPKSCINTNCAFIKNANDFKVKVYSNKNEYEASLEENNKVLEELIRSGEEISEISRLLKDCNTAIGMIDKFVFKISTGDDLLDYKLDINTFLKFLKNDISYIDELFDLTKECQAVSNYNSLTIDKMCLESNIEHLAILREQETDYNDRMSEISAMKQQRNKIDKSIEDYTIKVEEYTDSLSIIDEMKKTFDRIIELGNYGRELLTSIEEAKKKIKDNERIITLLENNTNKIDELDSKIRDIDAIDRNNSIERSKLEKNLNYIQILLENKTVLDEKFKVTKIVLDALDPKKGIPLVFIEKFLDSIKDETNELLELAYGSSFRIDFDLTDKDFFIRVYRLFSELEDISQASQGEVSLTTLSLSLAMIKLMIDKYNILYLDEIDSALSSKNRKTFLTMLEKQSEKMNIEQKFIITHNNEFYSYPVDLILFNMEENEEIDITDKEFMLNKHILFDLDEYKSQLL